MSVASRSMPKSGRRKPGWPAPCLLPIRCEVCPHRRCDSQKTVPDLQALYARHQERLRELREAGGQSAA